MILVFYFICLFSSIYNQSKFEIILKNLAYIRFIFYAISISFVLDEFKYLKKYFLYSLLSCYLLLFFGSVYEFIFKNIVFFSMKVPLQILLMNFDYVQINSLLEI